MIELACVAVFFVVAALLTLDIGIMIWADSVCDRACRDCTRAAANASDAVSSLSLAQAALRTHWAGNSFISNPVLNTALFVYQDYGGNPPPDTSPYVSCTTTVTVKLPAPVFFCGAKFDPSSGSMTFSKSYNFPIIKTQLYLPP